jgi:predicted DNA-binding ribbon-helix-helix protein
MKKRSFSIAGHRTSIALEPEFWAALQAQAHEERLPLVAIVARVDEARGPRNLASALRVQVLMRALGKAAPSF